VICEKEIGYFGSSIIWLCELSWCLFYFPLSYCYITEHNVDFRNFERHRREAVIMERLTSSENVVDLYAHCANTVLTEHASRGLDKVLLEDRGNIVPTKMAGLERLQLALQVAKGVADLHRFDTLHADLQDKQFLVVDHGNNDKPTTMIIKIKLNDFNRCRFFPRRNNTQHDDDANNHTTTTTICPIRIPSAPGMFRSPEEYKLTELTDKADVYSLGHVLYQILTTKQPFEGMGTIHIKAAVRNGSKPKIPLSYRRPDTSDAALAVLVHLCYEVDPLKRPSAADLVRELTSLIRQEEGKQAS
jgi:serine/threonine protein kinase